MTKSFFPAIVNACRRTAFVLGVCVAFALLTMFGSCDDNNDFSTSASARLSFPSDTLTFDTVLSAVGTPTYSFTVVNRTVKGIRISNVSLSEGGNSGFRVNVDGTYINEAYDYDIEVRSHDSIVVWVDLIPRYNDCDVPVLVSDKLLFTLESGVVQQVVLNAYTQDVNAIDGAVFAADTCLSSPRPYLISDTLRVARGATLAIAPGTTLYFAAKAELIVDGMLLAEGTADSVITFRGSRTDYMFSSQPYDRIPGQWGGITFTKSSFGNVMNHCDVHSGTQGLRCDSSGVSQRKLTIENSVVHNMKGDCMTLIYSDVFAGNSQITNAMGNAVTLHGGSSHFVHCTIANFYPFMGGRGKAVYIYNSRGGLPLSLDEALFENCIISGWSNNELGISFLDEPSVSDNYRFEACLITAAASSDTLHFANNVFESSSDEVWGSKNFISFDNSSLIYNFGLDTLSHARDIADTAITRRFYPLDLCGVERLADGHSDAGCYEFR